MLFFIAIPATLVLVIGVVAIRSCARLKQNHKKNNISSSTMSYMKEELVLARIRFEEEAKSKKPSPVTSLLKIVVRKQKISRADAA